MRDLTPVQVYGIFKYFIPNADPDSRIGHPWQPGLLKAHILVAPFAIMGVGLILRRHALVRLRKGEPGGRKTGASMLWVFLPLVLSGYLIQVFVAPGTVRWTGWIHAGIGMLFVLGYAFHPKRRAPASNGNGNGEAED